MHAPEHISPVMKYIANKLSSFDALLILFQALSVHHAPVLSIGCSAKGYGRLHLPSSKRIVAVNVVGLTIRH